MHPVIKKEIHTAQARRQSDRPTGLEPLAEHIALDSSSDVRVHGIQGLRIDMNSDTPITFCTQRIARKANENYRNAAEHVKALMDEFQGARKCALYWERREDDRASLVHRMTVSVADGKTGIDARKDVLDDPEDPAFQAYHSGQPVIFDYDQGMKIVFKDMNIDNDRCDVYQIPPEEGRGSLAVIPMYYRINDEMTGVAVFEGDLRCKGSKVEGFGKTFWSAKTAIAAVSQIGIHLTHRINPTTETTGSVDFDIDFKDGIRRLFQKKARNLYLMMIDLDRFKKVNDDHDYLTGDRVLVGVAGAIKASIRPSDLVHHIHGDEFAVLLPNVSSLNEAVSIANRIRGNVAALEVQSLMYPDQTVRVTCSVGVTNVGRIIHQAEGIGDHAKEMVEQVYTEAFIITNKMLHEAKGRGKDLSVVYN